MYRILLQEYYFLQKMTGVLLTREGILLRNKAIGASSNPHETSYAEVLSNPEGMTPDEAQTHPVIL